MGCLTAYEWRLTTSCQTNEVMFLVIVQVLGEKRPRTNERHFTS